MVPGLPARVPCRQVASMSARIAKGSSTRLMAQWLALHQTVIAPTICPVGTDGITCMPKATSTPSSAPAGTECASVHQSQYTRPLHPRSGAGASRDKNCLFAHVDATPMRSASLGA